MSDNAGRTDGLKWSDAPKRIQRKRTAGFNLQAASGNPNGVVYVGRPGIFGNPFSIEQFTPEFALSEFRVWVSGKTVNRWPHLTEQRDRLLAELPKLRGKDLACWCRIGDLCHADILLEIANREDAAK